MGRHVNYADEQDRWLNKAEKINRNHKKQNLEDRDPSTLSLAEQFELAKRRNEEKKRLKDEELMKPKKEVPRYTHYRPK
jgi:hypothetical protein